MAQHKQRAIDQYVKTVEDRYKVDRTTLVMGTTARTADIPPKGVLIYDEDLDTMYLGNNSTVGGVAMADVEGASDMVFDVAGTTAMTVSADFTTVLSVTSGCTPTDAIKLACAAVDGIEISGACTGAGINISSTTIARAIMVGAFGQTSNLTLTSARNYPVGVFGRLATTEDTTADVRCGWFRLRVDSGVQIGSSANWGAALKGLQGSVKLYGGTTTGVYSWAVAGLFGSIETDGSASVKIKDGCVAAGVFSQAGLLSTGSGNTTIELGGVACGMAVNNGTGTTNLTATGGWYGYYLYDDSGTGKDFTVGLYMEDDVATTGIQIGNATTGILLDGNFTTAIKMTGDAAYIPIQIGTKANTATGGLNMNGQDSYDEQGGISVFCDDGGVALAATYTTSAIWTRYLITANQTSNTATGAYLQMKTVGTRTFTTVDYSAAKVYFECTGGGTIASGAVAALNVSLEMGANLTNTAGLLAVIDVDYNDGGNTLTDTAGDSCGIRIRKSGTSAIPVGLKISDGGATTGILVGDATTGILLDGDFTTGISLKAEANADDGILIDAESTMTITDAIEITGAGTVTNGINFNVSGTLVTAIDIGACTTGVALTGAMTDGLVISGASSDNAIEITGVATGAGILIDYTISGADSRAIHIDTDTDATSGDHECFVLAHTNSKDGINNLRAFTSDLTLGADCAGPYAGYFRVDIADYTVTGLSAALGMELILSSVSGANGEAHGMTIDIACPDATSSPGSVSNKHSFIKLETWGNQTGEDAWDDNANIFFINGLTSGAGNIVSADENTLRINIEGTSRYMVLSTAENTLNFTAGLNTSDDDVSLIQIGGYDTAYTITSAVTANTFAQSIHIDNQINSTGTQWLAGHYAKISLTTATNSNVSAVPIMVRGDIQQACAAFYGIQSHVKFTAGTAQDVSSEVIGISAQIYGTCASGTGLHWGVKSDLRHTNCPTGVGESACFFGFATTSVGCGMRIGVAGSKAMNTGIYFNAAGDIDNVLQVMGAAQTDYFLVVDAEAGAFPNYSSAGTAIANLKVKIAGVDGYIKVYDAA